MAMQSHSSSSSSFSYDFSFDVFISFRGADTRSGFTGNLYKALCDKGIHTFIDDKELQKGEKITPSLLKSIEDSRISIIVFSKDYASSSFCLDELVHIIHCYKTKGRLVLPVFFGVDPTDVRHQSGSYAEHLTKHEERFRNNQKHMERWHQWKMALAEAANFSGYHYSLSGYEYRFIEKIVEDISNKINRVFLHVAKYPVGLHSRVQQVKLLLDKESDEGVHMVGLYGTGGLGKSTLAKAIYNFIADQFEELCFLENVRENSTLNNLKHLQEKLLLKTVRSDIKLGGVSEGITIIKKMLCRKKILLILDDVDKLGQLEALAGRLDWFGRGSRVIITTRDKHLLTCHGIECTHAVEGLYGTEALELLRWMAFKNNKVPSSYEDILNRAVSYASGLPLVIEIVGSNLFGRSIEECKYTLDGCERIPIKEIQKILRVSYDSLEEEEQSVFLDIACCFKGHRLTEVEDILHAHYGHCIKHHVQVLVEKSVIGINSQYHWPYNVDVTLHDLIEDMGKEIVRQESRKDPGERSRLWCHDDIVHILQKNTGTGNIEMIYLNCPSMEPILNWNRKAFKKMTNLRTLIIKSGQFSKSPKYLPSTLRVLKLNGCPWRSLSSGILNKKFEDMKVLTFDSCEYLTHIPNVSGLPNLEKLSFQKCNNLITIHDSIEKLNKLEILNAKECIKLESFPPLRLTSLKELELYKCRSLKSFPELLCKMTNIKEISLEETSIGELSFSFQNLNELRYLSLCGCEMLRFPVVLKWCANVNWLNLSCNNFKILPCLSDCHFLRNLNLDNCKSLEEIRGIPPNLNYLSALKCESLSSSSRRMLLSQQLHEAGCTDISFPTGTEGIPDWFEHKVRGDTISFSFRKIIPSISIIIILYHLPEGIPCIRRYVDEIELSVNMCVNGYEYTADHYGYASSFFNHTYLFDMDLEESIMELEKSVELNEALLKNELVHVELRLKNCDAKTQMGIHVLKGKNVIFTNPYRKRKLDQYIYASLTQSHPTLKKHRFVEVGVSETESLQQQFLTLVSGMRNLVLTETK